MPSGVAGVRAEPVISAIRLRARQAFDHAMRTQRRFGTRLGAQFAAAITYFSVVSLVPTLMFGFSMLGFVLTVLRPDLLEQVHGLIMSRLAGLGPDLQARLGGLVDSFLAGWRGVGIVALVAALWIAAGWAGNLKGAIRALSRDTFEVAEPDNPIRTAVVDVLSNIALMVGLLVLVGLALTCTALVYGSLPVPVRVLAPVVGVFAGWLVFVYLLSFFPEHREPWPVRRRAALIGGIGFTALQYLAGWLVAVFAGNPAAAVFGSVIVLMLVLNLIARLVLYVAAWAATYRSADPAGDAGQASNGSSDLGAG